jgi:cyclopropane fatty-acyl-phospholipid synthase-like methyltransferase
VIESRIPLTRDDIALHYDDLDHFYRSVWGEHVHHGLWLRGDETPDQAARRLVEFVAEKARVTRASRVCDAGCGYGATARMLADDFGAQVTALTVSPAQFRHAVSRAPLAVNPSYALCDWLENQLPDESFDAVIAIESTEHMPDKPAFFAQAHRVLRAGGRLVVSAWLAHERASVAQQRFLLEPICRESRMPAIGSEREYRDFFAAAGFEVESFNDLTARVKKTWPVCVRRFLSHLCHHPRDTRFLFNTHSRNRTFALTIVRIWIAYNTGALRYGVFTGRRIEGCTAT